MGGKWQFELKKYWFLKLSTDYQQKRWVINKKHIAIKSGLGYSEKIQIHEVGVGQLRGMFYLKIRIKINDEKQITKLFSNDQNKRTSAWRNSQ